MDKRTKKELERLSNIAGVERDLLRGLYGDMFGQSSSSQKNSDPKKESALRKEAAQRREAVKQRFTDKEPTAADLLDQAYKNRKDPLLDAKKALKEAQDLMSKTDEFTQEIMESNRKGIENLADMTGNTGTITPGGVPLPSQTGAGQQPVQTASGGPAPESAETEQAPKEPEKDPMEELDALVGLTTIKHDVKELMAFVKIQKMRRDAGLKSVPVSLHLVFTGNPGTGKTTVARIIGRLYKQIGVLSKGQLIEVDRSGLVAGYVGQTALKTQDQIHFIDEAYALAQKDDAFGQEAIDTVLKAMEDHRDDLVVIVAGYTKPMEKFIDSNPGLKSRFNKYIEFPDYTIDELEQIFYLNCEKYDYVVEEDAKKQIRARIVSRKMQRQENFANAREVRNMFEDIITNQARRVAEMENPTHEDMMKITLMDLSEDIGDKTDSKEIEKMEEAAKEAATPVLELSDGETVPEEPEEGPDREEGLKDQGKTEDKA